MKRVHGHALTGVRGQRVQRGQPCGWDRDRDRGRGAWWRSDWWLNLVAGKTIQPPWRAREMHPYPRLRRYFPRRGKFALCFPVESCGTLLSIHSPTASAGGRWWRSHQRGGRFSHARRAVVRFYHTGAPLFSKAPTTPSEPCEPFAPSEPSRPKGVSIRAPASLDPGPDLYPVSITHRAPVSSRPHSLQSFLR